MDSFLSLHLASPNLISRGATTQPSTLAQLFYMVRKPIVHGLERAFTNDVHGGAESVCWLAISRVEEKTESTPQPTHGGAAFNQNQK